MRLKSFTTYGFKSFADKTELTFDKGITAVVGPNGSGKSNISDAIRWVLGEQSAKYLRGSKMEDVIFSGSSKRRALGAAEVTLNFDNTDASLPLDFAEVSLTRRIFRSGDSEYAINKKSCRLKDIVDLMADTGLGKGSMSIIGQNKIDEILNSRAEDRRALFEEAAGIAKYRLRKKEAVRRLDSTADNLTRINDIRAEVDAQVGPLALAAEKTRTFNALSEELRSVRLTILLRKLDEMQKKNAALLEQKETAANAYAQAAAALSAKEAEATAIQQALDKLAENFTRLQDEIKNQETALEKMRGQQGVLDERAQQSKRAGERLAERNTRLLQQAEELEQKMQELAAAFDAADEERVKAQFSVDQLQKEREEKHELWQQAQQQAEATQSAFFAGMQTLLTERNELRALEQEQEQRMRRRDLLKKNIEEAETAQATIEADYKNKLNEQARLANEMELLTKEQQEFQAAEQQLQNELRQMQGRQNECQRQVTNAEVREQGLRRLQNAYEGFGYGIKNVLKAQQPWRENIVGVVAELIKVEDKFVTALETALGESAQNIVTRDANTAKTAIAYLKQSGGGRATFLPLDTVQRRTATRDEEAVARMPGICGFAVDLVQYNKEAENAIRFLLGRVLVAENIDAALNAARAAKFRLRVVTLDGDVVNAGGSMSGGSRKHKEGYLSRELEIKQIGAQLKALRAKALACQEEQEICEQNLKEVQNKLLRNNAALSQQKLKTSEIKLRLTQLQQELTRSGENLLLLYDDRKEVTDAYLANRDRVKELRASVAQRESQDTEAKEKLEALNKEIAALGSAVTALDNRLQDAKISLEKTLAKTQYTGERIQEHDQNILRVREEIKGNEEEQERLQAVIADCAMQKEKLAQESEQALQTLQQIIAGREDFVRDRGELLAKQSDVDGEITTLRKQAMENESALRQTELDLARHGSDYTHVLEQLREEYDLDEAAAHSQALDALKEMELKSLQKEESRLTLKISALGPINAAAIEEYAAIKERSEFLQKQYDDLCAAKENLESVIGEINSGMVKRFKEAFAKINEYFAQCYIKLFGGGTALLRLTEPDNILDSGIDIEVQPPGKKLQSLYLMSGGERALTVIALLFALLTYQPSPFCVLDEIDAPLDDANIQRFANFLRDYAKDTQFIIITHRKGTMEAADIMYGVTMEESGVSKLLSVKLEETA